MTNIALCWEFGDNTGHLHRLGKLASAGYRRGWQMAVITKALNGSRAYFPNGTPLFQAPVPAHQIDPGRRLNYSDILAHNGYGEVGSLHKRVRAWRNLNHRIRPDLILADHAPTALLAARIDGIPAASLGSGFLIPPDESPLPPFDWVTPPPRTALKRVERAVLATVNQVLSEAGAQPLERLSDLLAPEERFLLTHPRLDHYPRRPAHEEYWGLLTSSRQQPDQLWPPGEGPRVLGYLRTEQKGFEPLLRALGGMRVRGLIHAPDCPEELARTLSTPQLRLTREPLNLDRLADECDLGVGYGSPGFVTDLLLAGKPLLLAPIHMEQAMLSRRLFDQSCAEMAPPHWKEGDYVEALTRLIEEPEWTREAEDLGRALRGGPDTATVLERVADRCEGLIRKGPRT
ncbi:MAG: hypothetical protein R6U87_00535 [Thiohalospira sp.]